MLDIDEDRMADLTRGRLPFFATDLESLLVQSSARLRFTTDYASLADAAVTLLTVPSPLDTDGDVGLSFLRATTTSLATVLAQRSVIEPMLIVNKCTVPVGMVRLLGELINELLPPGRTDQTTSRGDVFSINSSPEFPREGKAVFDTLFPDRLVLGAASEADASGSTPYRLPSSSGASRPTSLRYRQVPPCLG